MKLALLVLSSLALCAEAFVSAPAAPVAVRAAAYSSPQQPPHVSVSMGTGRGASRNKKAKAAVRKMKSSRAAAKVTARPAPCAALQPSAPHTSLVSPRSPLLCAHSASR